MASRAQKDVHSAVSAAVLLGQQKLGVREKISIQKCESSRRNGIQPVRPGNRQRGRPRQNATAWQQFVLKGRTALRVNMTVGAMLKVALRQHAELDVAIAGAPPFSAP